MTYSYPSGTIFLLKDLLNTINTSICNNDWNTANSKLVDFETYNNLIQTYRMTKLYDQLMIHIKNQDQSQSTTTISKLLMMARPLPNDLPFKIGTRVRVHKTSQNDFVGDIPMIIVERTLDSQGIWNYVARDGAGIRHTILHTRHAERILTKKSS